MGMFIQWSIIRPLKGKTLWYMLSCSVDESWRHFAKWRKPHVVWLHLYEIARIGQFRDRKWIAMVWRLSAYGCSVSFGVDKNVLELDTGDHCTTLVYIPKTTTLYTLKGWALW